MPFCHNCGQKLPDGAKFCTECGTPTVAPVTPVAAPAPQPVPETPVYEEPVYEAPVYEQPVYETPAPQPVPEAPVYEEPVYEAPVYEQPVYEAPAYEAPSYASAPEQPAPAASGYFTPTPRAGAKPPKAPKAPAAQHAQSDPKKRSMLILAIAAGVVLVAIIAVVLLLTLGGKDKGSDVPEAPKSSLAGSKTGDETSKGGGKAAGKGDSTETGKGSGKAAGKGDSTETGKGSGKAAGKGAALAGDETPESAEARPEDTAEEEAESTDEEDALLQEQGMLLAIYQAMLEALADETTDDFAAANNNGYVWEYDDDGYPEMTFLCSLDGVSLSAIIARRTDDSMNPMMIEEILWDVMPADSVNAIFSGVLDGEPVLYLEALSSEAGCEVGRSYVYSLANTTIEKLYELEWTSYEDGTLNTCCVMDGNSSVISTDDEDHFLSIYNCSEYYEASYPYKDGCGRLFEDMLSDEALELIYG